MPRMIKLECEECEEEFDRYVGEANRSKKKGMPSYCSRSCSVAAGNRKTPRGVTDHLVNRKTEGASFKWFMARVKCRVSSKQWERNKTASALKTDLTHQELKRIWDDQDGKCPFTGWDLTLPESTLGWKEDVSPKRASLDRIDNNNGYVKGNVRFVSVMFNYCRNGFEDADVLEFCEAVCDKLEK